MTSDPTIPAGLFDVDTPPPASLADRFIVPPLSVLDRRSAHWSARKRAWLDLGIQSGDTRSGVLLRTEGRTDDFGAKLHEYAGGVSIFDPVICEIVYRWYTRPGARVLDPFAGGSVRGIVASTLARHYVGIDIRDEQIQANRRQATLGSEISPTWIVGDATRLHDTTTDEYDLIFSCPPYADLERYSDHPRDISTWTYEAFTAGHTAAIRDATALLHSDRFAAWVISDIRDRRGYYRGLVVDTIAAFRAAGLHLLNDLIVVDPIGSTAMRAARPHLATRKAARVHQHLLVFVKGSAARAAKWAGAS